MNIHVTLWTTQNTHTMFTLHVMPLFQGLRFKFVPGINFTPNLVSRTHVVHTIQQIMQIR